MKKIRGTRRHIRRVDSLQPTPTLWPPNVLNTCHYHYAKLGLGPWHWHSPLPPGRQPPHRIRQLAAMQLLNTFFAWQEQLKAREEAYYLAVWLVSSDFAHESKVAVGIREEIERYQDRTGEPVPDGPPLPSEYQQLPGAERLSWNTHPWEILLDADDYPDNWPTWALAKPHHLYTSYDGCHYLVVQTGWLWVGILPELKAA